MSVLNSESRPAAFARDVFRSLVEPIGSRTVPGQRFDPWFGGAYLVLDALLSWVVIGWANELPFDRMLLAHAGLYLLRGVLVAVVLGPTRLKALFSGPLHEFAWSAGVVMAGAAACLVVVGIALIVAPRGLIGAATGFGSEPQALSLLIVSVLMTVLLAPVVEEAIDRAVFLDSLLAQVPGWMAVLASAALFGFMHAIPYRQGGIPLFPFIGGGLTAVAFVMRRSLIAPIMIHAAGNALLVAVDALVGNVTMQG